MKWIQFFTILLLNLTVVTLVIRHYYSIPVRMVVVPKIVYKTVPTTIEVCNKTTEIDSYMQSAQQACQANNSGKQLTDFRMDNGQPSFLCN